MAYLCWILQNCFVIFRCVHRIESNTYPSYHPESEYGIVNSIILNMFELWLNSYSLYATFEPLSTLAQRSGQNFRISQLNYTDKNNPIDKYLGIVNPLLTITNLQVYVDITNLKAMCTTWLAV